MGRYVTTTSLPVLMPQFLLGNTSTSDTAGVDVFSTAIDYAEGEINSILVNKYDPSSWTTTGSPGIPPMVRAMAADLACYRAARSISVQDAQIRNLNLENYKPVLELLANLRDGKVKLAYTDGSLVPSRTTNRFLSSTENYAQVFGLDSETAWARDPDEVSDQSSAREG